MVSRSLFDIRLLFLSLLLILFALGVPSLVTPASSGDNVTVSVNVSNVTQITVIPPSITWTLVEPGANTAPTNVTVKNTGGASISTVYVTSDARVVESSNPLGTNNPSLYSSSGVIMILNETSGANFTHVGRVEWNLTHLFGGVILNLAGNVLNWSYGWYRNATDDTANQTNDVADNEFLWKVENGTCGSVQAASATAWCNCTDATFTILGFPENSTSTSITTSRDFSSSTYRQSVTATSANQQYAVFDVGSTPGDYGPLAGYCVAVPTNCKTIFIYKYDPVTLGACNSDTYLASSVLAPGNELNTTRLIASVPLGTPGGTLASGQIGFTATT